MSGTLQETLPNHVVERIRNELIQVKLSRKPHGSWNDRFKAIFLAGIRACIDMAFELMDLLGIKKTDMAKWGKERNVRRHFEKLVSATA